jgi:transposase
MPTTKPPYPAEFRQQIIERVSTGRSPAELAREFGCTAQTIANWVAQSAIDRRKPLPGKDGLTSAEREELARLRRENRQLKLERDILSNWPHGAPLPCGIETRSAQLQDQDRGASAVFTWIEAWYNPRRRHSAHGRISPINFERMHADELKTPPPGAQHGLPTAGLCVAGATPAVDNPAPMLIET